MKRIKQLIKKSSPWEITLFSCLVFYVVGQIICS